MLDLRTQLDGIAVPQGSTTAAAQKKLAAIVAIDVAGYSALTERDQDQAASIIARFRAQAGAIAEAHGGRIFSTAGDGAMLEFLSATDALSAAMAICDASQEAPLRFGVHLGEVVVAENGDLLGHGVNVAARLQAAAEPGSILVSQLIRDTVQGPLSERLTSRGRIKLAKMRETMNVFALAPRDAKSETQATARTPTLAVLPFDNLSRDKDTRFFSDGVSEEILYSVSRVKGLKVIGSTSSFAFRGRDKQKAAKALAATHVLDGSVRRAEDRVRIAAQLTDAETGVVLWSERYDRELDNAFALQEEIAAEVAGALALALGAARKAQSQRVTASVFDAYLRAREQLRSGAPASIRRAAEMLADIVRDAPDFARGWSALGLAKVEVLRMSRTDRVTLADEAREAAQRAIGLDAEIGEAYAVLAALEPEFGRWSERERLCLRALEAEPNNAFLLFRHGQLLISVGRVREGYLSQARAYELDPLDPMFAAFHGHNVWATTSKDEGRKILDESAARAPDNIFLWYMRINTSALDGDFARVDALRAEGERILPGIQDSPVIKAGRMMQDVLRDPSPEAFVRLGEDYMAMAEEEPSAALDLAVAMSAFGLVKPAFAIFEEALENTAAWRNGDDALRPHVGYETALLFIQATIMLRMDHTFVRLCSRLGLVRYWRETGNWPDCVDEVSGAYDFRKEAAKYV